MAAQSVRISVEQLGDSFLIQAENVSGQSTFTIVARWAVIGETVKALQFVLHDKHKVKLDAPDWVKAELEQRGFRFE